MEKRKSSGTCASASAAVTDSMEGMMKAPAWFFTAAMVILFCSA